MTAQVLLLLLLVAAFVVSVFVLVHEWRWRDSPARPPLPGSQALGSLLAAVAAGVGRGGRSLRGRIRRGHVAGRPDAGLSAEAVESVVAGRPRAVRPTRIVVSGSRGPAMTGMTVTAARSDPRQRLVRDTVAVLSLGVAVVAFLLLVQPPTFEEAVLGATGTPYGGTPLPALASVSPSATPTATPSSAPGAGPTPTPTSSGAPVSPSATDLGSATPRPTATPRAPTPRPTRTPAPARTPAPTPTPASPVPSADASASPPEPSPTGAPSASPSPAVSPSPAPNESPSPSPDPSTPPPSPSP